MSRRRARPRSYAGATKAVTLAEAKRLDGRWAVQRKHDGIYVQAHLDAQGRLCRVLMRSGAEVSRQYAGHLYGALLGSPHADLVGELDAMTEAGEAAARVGPRRLHLFDLLHTGVRSTVREPYAARRRELEAMLARVAELAPDDSHVPAPWRKYRDPVPPGYRLCPVVAQRPMSELADAWEQVLAEDLEGIVLVDTAAPVGARSCKLKLKPIDQIDAEVVHVSRTTVTVRWRDHYVNVNRSKLCPSVGEVVSLHHNGFQGSIPRHARIVAARRDLV